jgi:hypothetical protein
MAADHSSPAVPGEAAAGEPEFTAELHDHHGVYQLRVVRAPDAAELDEDQRPARELEVLTGPVVRRVPAVAGPARAQQHAEQRLAAGRWEHSGAWGWDSDDRVHWIRVRRMTCPETVNGMPVHLRDLSTRDGELTRCGAFADGMPGRVSDQRDDVSCADCLSEGPVRAWVTLPDGRVIERRCAALEEYLFAVAVPGRTGDDFAWRLGCWAKDPAEARIWCSARYARDAQIVQVQLAGRGKGVRDA